jgi:hypothetical protein
LPPGMTAIVPHFCVLYDGGFGVGAAAPALVVQARVANSSRLSTIASGSDIYLLM